jgi:response regulator RpfG family c-di-GMP phosphodiesterase
VYNYVTKPWANQDLLQTVSKALQHYETIKSQHDLKLQNERLEERLETTRANFVKVFTDILGAQDPLALDHARRTSSYALAIGQNLGLERHDLDQLSLAALLHQIEYLDITVSDLSKMPEDHISGSNTRWGLRLLASNPDFEEIAFAIRHRHEKWNGSGEPGGLIGEQIPLHSRIIAVAAAYDEMTVPNSPELPLSRDEAIIRLQYDDGEFDPEVIDIFCELNQTLKSSPPYEGGVSAFR